MKKKSKNTKNIEVMSFRPTPAVREKIYAGVDESGRKAAGEILYQLEHAYGLKKRK